MTWDYFRAYVTTEMPIDSPHYLLLTDAERRSHEERQWRFVLQPVGAGERIAAEDAEFEADANRLELLAVVRGLEALDGPSRVTLLCGSRYVRRGIQNDLSQWRDSGWRWECFGKMVPIRDLDLWQRVDRALAIHNVDCYFGLQIADCGFNAECANSQSEIRNPKSDDSDMLPALAGAALSRSA